MDDTSEQPFPIAEGFGFPFGKMTPQARKAWSRKWCPFGNRLCEKQVQYGFGYCSVTYAAEQDAGERQIYAVCDHRLDGLPIRAAIHDKFGERSEDVELVEEVVLTKPRTSFDYVALTREKGQIHDAVVIETQAVDIRGGGVGPAWRAWRDGHPQRWREYFTAEARKKGRKDTVAYGVNMANIYKRLGMQIATKAGFLKGIGVPMYVVMQDRPFQYLRRRIAFAEASDNWDITFLTFDYTGRLLRSGALEFAQASKVRTTVDEYLAALQAGAGMAGKDRKHFLERVERKARLAK